jgi:hypothetical protein
MRITYPGQVSVKHMVRWASHDLHVYPSRDKDWVRGVRHIKYFQKYNSRGHITRKYCQIT